MDAFLRVSIWFSDGNVLCELVGMGFDQQKTTEIAEKRKTFCMEPA